MAEVAVLTGERITLRAPIESDVAELQAYGLSPEIARGYGVDLKKRLEYTDEDMAGAWRTLNRDAYGWSILLDGRLIGHIGIHHVERHDDRAMLRVGMYDDQALGKGYGTEAVLLVARYAFEEVGFHRLSLRVLASNARAIRCYEKCGFKQRA